MNAKYAGAPKCFTKLTISSWLLEQIGWGLHWLVELSHISHELLQKRFLSQYTVNTQMQIISWLINVFKISKIHIIFIFLQTMCLVAWLISNLNNCTPSCYIALFNQVKHALIEQIYRYILCKLAELLRKDIHFPKDIHIRLFLLALRNILYNIRNKFSEDNSNNSIFSNVA